MGERTLRSGDLVEVRSAAEILATVDEHATTDGLPFMPEMVAYCGRRLTVERQADKVCDTIKYQGCVDVERAVILDDARCDGSGHDGCQAECRFYWKEAWLKPVTPDTAPPPVEQDAAAVEELQRRAAGYAKVGERYRCQATELLAYSTLLSKKDPRPYLHQVTKGNVGVRRFATVMGRAVVVEGRRKIGRLPDPPLTGPAATSPPSTPLDLDAGDWVRVRSPEEIRATLNDRGKNRGLWFDREMLPFCGQVFQVRQRITRLIDETNGEMITLTSDCVSLDGVVCSGERSVARWFCPRAIYPYWRECWLERVEGPA